MFPKADFRKCYENSEGPNGRAAAGGGLSPLIPVRFWVISSFRPNRRADLRRMLNPKQLAATLTVT